MAEKMKFKVLRRHDGDRMYEEGEVRVGTEADLGHLVPKVLELMGPADKEPAEETEKPSTEKPAEPGEQADAKSESAPMNKAEPAPANKSEQPTRRKRGK